VDGSSDREVKEMVRLSSLLTKPSTKDALHANKTLGCSCTTLVVAPDDEKSLPMIPINEAVKTAG